MGLRERRIGRARLESRWFVESKEYETFDIIEALLGYVSVLVYIEDSVAFRVQRAAKEPSKVVRMNYINMAVCVIHLYHANAFQKCSVSARRVHLVDYWTISLTHTVMRRQAIKLGNLVVRATLASRPNDKTSHLIQHYHPSENPQSAASQPK